MLLRLGKDKVCGKVRLTLHQVIVIAVVERSRRTELGDASAPAGSVAETTGLVGEKSQCHWTIGSLNNLKLREYFYVKATQSINQLINQPINQPMKLSDHSAVSLSGN